MSPWVVKGALALLILVLTFALGWRTGGASCRVSDAAKVLKQVESNSKQESLDEIHITREAITLAAAQASPVAAPVVRLCNPPPRSVPATTPARPEPDGEAPIRGLDSSNAVPGPDIGRPLVQSGRDADAQVIALQDYIQHVCRVEAP